jgi:uncharacterized integral membrane protein (TIGR00697 family)
MNNELLLIISLFVIYGGVILAYKFYGKAGLYCWTVFATVTANIEVLLMVKAFGMEQTLGNVLFASTFLVTDILSEMEGKEAAAKAVNLGVVTSALFILLSQSWLLYTPSSEDWARPSFEVIFSNTPRLLLASLLVYAVSQRFDVWAYHKWWEFTSKKFGDSERFLWLRNNGSTLISQLLNTVLYTFGAFLGMYDMPVLLSICLSTYVIYVVTSLLDTPFIYMAKKIGKNNFS